MTLQPEGEPLRKAVLWISEEKKAHPEKLIDKLIETACLNFNLNPKEATFLSEHIKEIVQ